MNADLAELQQSVQRVLDGCGVPADEGTTWPLLSELGWLLVSVPEELGGLGLGVAGASVLHAELGRKVAAVPFLPAMLAIDALCHSEVNDRDRWIERLTAGEYVAAPLAACSIRVQQGAGGSPRITGRAAGVQSADRASHVLVWSADFDCVVLVPREQPGVAISEQRSWDSTRRLFDLSITDIALDAQLVVASGSAARQICARLATLRDFALAADSVGGASALLGATVEHLQTRRQFGRPLALFQALKHRCADLKTLIAAAEALLQDSQARHAERIGEPDAELQGMTLKQLACSTYARVAEEALQLHGGIGMASEHSCHLFLKRAMLNQHLGRHDRGYELDIAAALIGNFSW